MEEGEPVYTPDAAPGADPGSGGFRLMSKTEVERKKREEERRKAQEKAASKFRPFSGFGNAAHKGRNQSFDDESPSSSKRYVKTRPPVSCFG